MNNPHLERRDPESAPRPKRTDGRHPSQQAKQEAKKACDRPQMNHASKAQPQRQHRQPNYHNDHGNPRVPSRQAQMQALNCSQLQRQHHQPNYHNYNGNPRVPSRQAQKQAPNTKHPDHNRRIRQLYQQRNLQRIIAAQNSLWQQSHIAPGQRLQRGLSNTTDASFA